MQENKNQKLAILIDGDNAQAKLLKPILEEVSKYGRATIRRIYGDWTVSHMNSWKDSLNRLAFTPIQKFSYTSGKNSTDSALIIDAMDILHNKIADGFCIVSSDSDYTGLAKRIREEGMFVMGIGEKKTPNPFVQSCEIFTFTENIISESVVNKPEKSTQVKKIKKELPKIDLVLINKAYEMSSDEDSGTLVSTIGHNIRKIEPSFDVRSYGFPTLTRLFESIPGFHVIKKEMNGVSHPFVTRRKN
jgi:uncharacterized LabA/DUF88 family protein